MRHFYIGTFLLALATLALEVALTRVLSLVTWYHLAFFALSTAMLGMTAGAVRVYLQPARFSRERWGREAANAALTCSFAIPGTLALLCLVPSATTLSTMGLVSLLVTTIACSVPFYFIGIAITLALTRSGLPIGRIYGADLIGAALGCLFVLGGLNVRGAPSVILWCASIGAFSALFYGRDRSGLFKVTCLLVGVGWAVAGATNSYGRFGIYPLICKSMFQMPSSLVDKKHGDFGGRFTLIEFEEWSVISRVSVSPEVLRPPTLWMPSPKMPPGRLIPQRDLQIDGGASTTLCRFASLEDLEHQKYDIVNVPYYLRPTGGAAVIGVGGGKDTQSAIVFGHKRVVAIDVNPAITDLLTGRFRKFVGLADHPGIKIINDDARAYLTRTDEKFALIQMSLVDSWASTQAGAFTLSENALYTIEAWEIFLGRLSEGGIFTVTRFFDTENTLGEAGRMISLGVAALLKIGVKKPTDHLALVTLGRAGTLLLSNKPLTEADRTKLAQVCGDLAFDLTIIPGEPCDHPDLRRIIESESLDELRDFTRTTSLNYDPPTDEAPYFFNLLRLENLTAGLDQAGGILTGNTMATFVLMGLMGCLGVLALLTIVVPLLLHRRIETTTRTSPFIMLVGGLYFSAIGAGFMFAEIALIQRLSVYLGNPTYALGVLLFTVILTAGFGSLSSGKLSLTRPKYFVVFALLIVAVLYFLDDVLLFAIAGTINGNLAIRVAVSISLIAPLGFLMGLFFPTGMRLATEAGVSDTPWFWALNGVFGVLSSACAVFVSLYLGISTNYQIAAVCYASLIVTNLGFRRSDSGQVEMVASDSPVIEASGPLA